MSFNGLGALFGQDLAHPRYTDLVSSRTQELLAGHILRTEQRAESSDAESDSSEPPQPTRTRRTPACGYYRAWAVKPRIIHDRGGEIS